jgi:hypothetical protein
MLGQLTGAVCAVPKNFLAMAAVVLYWLPLRRIE